MKISSKSVIDKFKTPDQKPHVLPIYTTSAFSFHDMEEGIDIFKGDRQGHVYSRYGNPTIEATALKIARLEGHDLDNECYGYMTSSGMSAINTIIQTLLKPGDAMLTQGDLYGGTTESFNKLFARIGINIVYTDLNDIDAISSLISSNKNIKLIYFETPSNPTLSCIDVKNLTAVAKKNNVFTVIDNTFATPILQRPLTMGVDFVIHSSTKFLNGHGNSISGAIVGHREEWKHKIWETLKLNGATCNPFDAWLTYNGMKTLALRMERHSSNAMKLAKFLQSQTRVLQVNYPGLSTHVSHEIASRQMEKYGGMLSFEVNGTIQDTIGIMNKLSMCNLTPTLGNVDTLVLHPATSSHLKVKKEVREEYGISDGLIRVSVGIEDIEDIIADFSQALGL